jgi:uncharacterized protein (DUF4415 family)
MSEDSIVRRTRRLPKKGKTDWQRVRALTDKEIQEAVDSDPDAAPLMTADWWLKHGRVVLPVPKKGVYIRFDRDMVEWFQKQGPRYQTRMNAILRSFMQAHLRGEKKASARSKPRTG